MRTLKVLLLKAIGFQGEEGELGLYLGGDQRGRFLIIEIHEIHYDEMVAQGALLNRFLKRIEKRNSDDDSDSEAA
jgi:hypothetical protein